VVVAIVAGPLRVELRRAVIASAPINLATQPALYLGLRRIPAAAGEHWWVVLGLAELAVVLLEAALYLAFVTRSQPRAVRKALAVSLAANAASAVIGLALPV